MSTLCVIIFSWLGSTRMFLGFGSTKIRLDSAQLFYGSAFAAPAPAYRSSAACLLAFTKIHLFVLSIKTLEKIINISENFQP